MNTRVAAAASERLLRGAHYITRHPVPSDVPRSYGYGYDRRMTRGLIATGSDGSMGVGYMLLGLTLAYLRTRDPRILPIINDHIEYFLALERASIAAYGAAASGTPSYWFWPGPDPFLEDFGANAGLITYQPGDPRKWTSSDQITSVTLGLYAVTVLLAPYAAKLATYDAAVAFLARLSAFEATTSGTVVGVLRDSIGEAFQVASSALFLATNGAQGTHRSNGVTTTYVNTAASSPITNPYLGADYVTWQVNDGDNNTPGGVTNGRMLDFIRGFLAADTTPAGLVNLLSGAANDMLTIDLGRQTVKTSNGSWGALGTYPRGAFGFELDAGLKHRYNVTDGHYIEIVDGRRDDTPGRAFQKCFVLGLCALWDPTYEVRLNEAGVTVPVKEALADGLQDAVSRLIDPITGMVRYSVKNFQNGNTMNVDSRDGMAQVQTPDTAYGLCATEVYQLVMSGADPADYFQVART